MSSTTPERRTEPAADPRSPDRPTSAPDPTHRFRPHGSVAPTTGSAVEWQDPKDTEDTGPARVRHVVDRFDGAAGLLVLRLVTAVILAIRGLQKLQHLDVTRAQFAQLGIPSPDTLAVVVGGAEFAIAFALIIGASVRLAGLGITVITVGALSYVRWRTGDVFTAGQAGFNGELELLLAGVGLAFLGLGGGGWGVDRRFRRR
jgi:uncharacterized membrane protein YphA (DoxX/SURF4 family)